MPDWPVLTSTCDPASEQFRANASTFAELVADLRAVTEVAARGGSEGSRTRHVERGKLLPIVPVAP